MTFFSYSIENHYPDADTFVQAYPLLREKLIPDDYLAAMPIGITGFVSSWLHYYLDKEPSTPPKDVLEAMGNDVLAFNEMAQYLIALRTSEPDYMMKKFKDTEMVMTSREATVCGAELLRRYASKPQDPDKWENISTFVDNEREQRSLRIMLAKMLEIHPELNKELAFPTEERGKRTRDILVLVRRNGMHMPPDEEGLHKLYMERRQPLLNRVNQARARIINRPIAPAVRNYLRGKSQAQNVQSLDP